MILRTRICARILGLLLCILPKLLYAQAENEGDSADQDFAELAQAAITSLQQRSPFLPPGYNSQPAPRPSRPSGPKPQAPSSLEFTGYANIGGETFFNLFDKQSKAGYWVAMQDNDAPIYIRSFDAQNQSITIQSGGSTRILTLKGGPQKGTISKTPPTTSGIYQGSGPSGPRQTGPKPRQRIPRDE